LGGASVPFVCVPILALTLKLVKDQLARDGKFEGRRRVVCEPSSAAQVLSPSSHAVHWRLASDARHPAPAVEQSHHMMSASLRAKPVAIPHRLLGSASARTPRTCQAIRNSSLPWAVVSTVQPIVHRPVGRIEQLQDLPPLAQDEHTCSHAAECGRCHRHGIAGVLCPPGIRMGCLPTSCSYQRAMAPDCVPLKPGLMSARMLGRRWHR